MNRYIPPRFPSPLHTLLLHLCLSASCFFMHFALLYHCLSPDGSLLLASKHILIFYATFLAYSQKPQSIKVYCTVSGTYILSMASRTLSQTPSNSAGCSEVSRGSKDLQWTPDSLSPHACCDPFTAYSAPPTTTSCFGPPFSQPSSAFSGVVSF